MRTNQRRTAAARRLAIVALIGLSTGGCAQLVRDVAMLPIKTAQTIAVEQAKLPFRVAKQTTDAALDALFKGK
jgi:hypothetical protein